jgi:hypothetical protein
VQLDLLQNFESNVGQKPCSLEVLDGKLVLQQRVKKIKVIDNINLWTDAFFNFTMVLIENHPFKATEHKLMLSITFIFFTLCCNTSFPSSTSRLQGF